MEPPRLGDPTIYKLSTLLKRGLRYVLSTGRHFMTARILLVNFDKTSEERLTEIFRQKGHYTSIYRRVEPLAAHVSKAGQDIDLVVFDVSGNDRETLKQLGDMRRYRAQHGHRPMVLCVFRVYRGPRFELELERKGARVVYVR
jgi:hypothetical protein